MSGLDFEIDLALFLHFSIHIKVAHFIQTHFKGHIHINKHFIEKRKKVMQSYKAIIFIVQLLNNYILCSLANHYHNIMWRVNCSMAT